ncbi:MAG: hypothetical protein ABEJ87_00375 [Candidatus Nanohalobium sp.]
MSAFGRQDYDTYEMLLQEFSGEKLNGQMPEEAAILALDDVQVTGAETEERVRPGEYVRVQSPECIEGLAAVLPGEVFTDSVTRISEHERNGGGFVFTNGSRAERPEASFSNVELKSRFPDELRDYPETVHVHNVPEWYFCVGEFEMALGNENMPDSPQDVYDEARSIPGDDPNALLEERPDWFDTYTFEDEVLRVDSGQYHGIMSKDDEAYLGVARGDPSGEEEWVGKWDLEGNQFYDHFEEEPSLNQLVSY